MDYWKILLKEQRKRGLSGFSIPFLIGSQMYLPPNNIRQDIKQLILDILANDSFETCLRYCADTNELILEIKKPMTPVQYPLFNNSIQSKFSVSNANSNIGNTVENIIEVLTEKYQNLIDKGLFSVKERIHKRETDWGNYSGSEDKFIKECFKSL